MSSFLFLRGHVYSSNAWQTIPRDCPENGHLKGGPSLLGRLLTSQERRLLTSLLDWSIKWTMTGLRALCALDTSCCAMLLDCETSENRIVIFGSLSHPRTSETPQTLVQKLNLVQSLTSVQPMKAGSGPTCVKELRLDTLYPGVGRKYPVQDIKPGFKILNIQKVCNPLISLNIQPLQRGLFKILNKLAYFDGCRTVEGQQI